MNQSLERTVAENIRKHYETKSEKLSKLQELQSLDRKVRRPAEIFAYVFGTAGALVLGTDMSIAMEVILAGMMPLGIGIGVVGIAMVSLNYFLFNAILNSRKKKYAKQILELSDELLNA